MSFIMFYPLRFLSSPGDFLEFGLDCCGMRWDVLLFFLAGNYMKTPFHSLRFNIRPSGKQDNHWVCRERNRNCLF